MSDPNAVQSSERGLPELGQDPGPGYKPNAPARLEWGEHGTIPTYVPGRAMNVRKNTFKPTEEQKAQAQAALAHATKIGEDMERRLREAELEEISKPVFLFCPYCGQKLIHGGDFCTECGEKL